MKELTVESDDKLWWQFIIALPFILVALPFIYLGRFFDKLFKVDPLP